MRFKKIISLGLSQNDIRFVQAESIGHRVQIMMHVEDLNRFFKWTRSANSVRPIGHFFPNATGPVDFRSALLFALNRVYKDPDGRQKGLNFSSYILDDNTDSRVRVRGNVSANDIVMAYILHKLYGNSACPTENILYNLQDAHEMLTSEELMNAITESFIKEDLVCGGDIDLMFREHLGLNPLRFFNSCGVQVPGLFETYVPLDASGSWNLIVNDIIEMRVEFRFPQHVSLTGVKDNGYRNFTQSVVIPEGSMFAIRLQIVAI
jgi:hypothetical protein